MLVGPPVPQTVACGDSFRHCSPTRVRHFGLGATHLTLRLRTLRVGVEGLYHDRFRTFSRIMKSETLLLTLLAVGLCLGLFVLLWPSSGAEPKRAPSAEGILSIQPPGPTVAMAERAQREEQQSLEAGQSALAIVDVAVCSNDSDAPIESAVVVFFAAGSRSPIVAAAEPLKGRYRARLRADESRWVMVVQASGRADHMAELDSPPPALVTVKLAPSSTISGEVTLSSGAPPPFPVLVCAVESGRRDVKAMLGIGNDDRVVFPSAYSDSAGRFTIQGVDPKKVYTVACGGRGWVSPSASRISPGSDGLVRLMLWRVYGCLLRFEPAGMLTPWPSLARVSTEARPDPDTRLALPESWEILLAAIGCEWRMYQCREFERLWFCISKYDSGPQKTLRGRIDIPGFQSALLEAVIPPLAVERLSVVTQTLTPTATAFGTLRATFKMGYRTSRKAGRVVNSALVLRLQSADTPEHHFAFGVSNPSALPIVANGLPSGSYQVTLSLSSGDSADVLGSRYMTVGATPCDIEYSLEQLGYLEVGLKDAPGEQNAPAERNLTEIRLVSPERPTITAVFSEPPYVIEGLPPGTYVVEVSANVRGRPEGVVGKREGVAVPRGGAAFAEIEVTSAK